MKHFIIGTAGHVDHGKTVLVKALTGKDTDRLKEEKERGISIELGFAPFRLPSGIQAGLVDVPGHERFIKNMLAGVGGIDLVLLIIAADEGIMPQTREHLGIIDLLQIPQGVIVITKTDLVEEDWLELIKEEARELVAGTVLEGAPMAAVSAVKGAGIKELIQLIDEIAGAIKERPVSGQPRLSIDRVFSITGFGTVVTGTLIEGTISVGDKIEILPENIEARVRGVQVHSEKVEKAGAGQRVAVNLAGLECEEIGRGSVLVAPGYLRPSHRLDLRIRLLAGEEKPLVNRARVRVHLGTAEILARVILLEADEMLPGETGFAQLECEEPMMAARGDRVVIRSYSPMRTIGGGKIIDPGPPKRKRFDKTVIDHLATKEKGEPEDLVLQFILSSQVIVFTEDDISSGSGLNPQVVGAAIKKLAGRGELRSFLSDGKSYYISDLVFERKSAELINALEKYHLKYPLRPGISKEEIRSKHFKSLNNKLFNALLVLFEEHKVIRVNDESVSSWGFKPGPKPEQEQVFEKIETRYLAAGMLTPGWDEISSEFKLDVVGAEEVLNFFINSGILIKLDANVIIHSQNLAGARENIIRFLQENKEIGLGEARDLLKTSRKFALPIMDYFDKEKVTRRVDDKRVLY
ncbi:MAG: selenocysteine-specific translation elongation factor [Thermincola sp.]|jgi:selenocysteine-specific elongation factor|nr:selenocysteine-specific translation elongation factor [Thermincola sp.]MDT3703969.1 selenocysteine-specific translation elongation factor [Thermincola sp.]